MGRREARRLAVEYLRQLQERGETEVFLPGERAKELRGRRSGRRTEVRRAPARRPTKRAAVKKEGGSGMSDATKGTEEAAGAPVEVVSVSMAFSDHASTTDMFAPSKTLDSCATLEDVEKAALGCEKCELAGGRTKVVFGVGNPNAKLMFVGEAPGRDEDIQGIPFVGRAGQLLNKILEAAEIERDDVYIANIIKCRPPNNRTPLTNEIEACMPYLGRQVALIRPRIICTLGLPATQTILGIRGSMGSLRGKIYAEGDVKVIPTYHPAAALRDPKYKRPIWDDFQLVKREYTRE